MVIDLADVFLLSLKGIQYTVVFNHDKVLFNETFIGKTRLTSKGGGHRKGNRGRETT